MVDHRAPYSSYNTLFSALKVRKVLMSVDNENTSDGIGTEKVDAYLVVGTKEKRCKSTRLLLDPNWWL